MKKSIIPSLNRAFMIIAILTLSAGCSKSSNPPTIVIPQAPSDPIDQVSNIFNVRARASFGITAGIVGISNNQLKSQSKTQLHVSKLNQITSSDIVQKDAADVEFSLNKSLFQGSQSIQNSLLNFGELSIATLSDNDLICNETYHCLTAQIRAYITGPQSGIYSPTLNQSIPLYVQTEQTTGFQNLGVGESQSIVLESYNIPSSKTTLSNGDLLYSDFQFEADFTQSGAANDFQATVIVEYVLTGNGAPITPSTSPASNLVLLGSTNSVGTGIVVNAGINPQSGTTQKASDSSIIVKSGVH
jgi:hypothetical protein